MAFIPEKSTPVAADGVTISGSRVKNA